VVRLGRGYFELVEEFIVVSMGVLFGREMRGAEYGRGRDYLGHVGFKMKVYGLRSKNYT